MADQDGRLAAVDHFHQSAAAQIRGDEAVRIAGGEAVPAAEPVARTADDVDGALRVVAIQPGSVEDLRRDALARIGDDVAKEMGRRDAVDLPGGFQRAHGEVIHIAAAEAAGRGEAFAVESGFLQYAVGVGHVSGQFVGAFGLAPLPVFHVLGRGVGVGETGLDVDYAGVADHFGVNVPVFGDDLAHDAQTFPQFLLRPAGNEAVQPAGAGRVGHHAVFAFHAVIGTPFDEFQHEAIGDLAGQFAPVLLVVIGKDFPKLRDAVVGHIHQAGGIVDDEADRHAVEWVDYFDFGGGFPGEGLPPGVGGQHAGGGEGRGLEEVSSFHGGGISPPQNTYLVSKSRKSFCKNKDMQNLYCQRNVFIFRKITQYMLVVADIEIQNLTDDMSEEEFFAFCQANRELRIEKDQNGNVIIMPPTGSETGRFNTELITELNLWNRQTGLGLVFDSSTGFKLPNGAVRSPDASWIRKERWDTLAPADRKKFAPLCPDFVVELRSETDNLEKLREKMAEYIENGCQLAWLIDRSSEEVHIYQPQKDILHVHGFDQSLSGEDILPGFSFDLTLMR